MEWFSAGDRVVLTITSVDGGEIRAEVDGCGAAAKVVTGDRWLKHITPGCKMIIGNFHVSWCEMVVCFNVPDDAGSLIYIVPSEMRGEVRVAEFFSGLGGWTWASNVMGCPPCVLVEKDHDVNVVCAATHQIPILSPKEFLEAALDGKLSKTQIVEADVNDDVLWMGLGLMNVGVGCASPPCQPWSTTGFQAGLMVEDGAIFRQFLEKCAEGGFLAVSVENVPGFYKHKDYKAVVNVAESKGMKLVLGEVISARAVLPIVRDRWLGVFLHESIIDHGRVDKAKAVCLLGSVLSKVQVNPNMSDLGVVEFFLDPGARTKLVPSQDAFVKYSDLRFLPKWMQEGMAQYTEHDVLKRRTRTFDQPLTGAMACYGSQHDLPCSLIQHKGIHTCLVDDGKGLRFWSPWEVLACMGHGKSSAIDGDLVRAWRQTGNTITTVHAWLQLRRMHEVMGNHSVFPVQPCESEQLQELQNMTLRLDDTYEVCRGSVLLRHERPVEKDDAKRMRMSPPEGLKMSPTLEWQVDHDVEVCTEVVEEEITFLQKHVQANDGRSPSSFCMGGILVLKHVEGHWMMVVHGAVAVEVGIMIQRALPHAEETDFECLEFQGKKVDWKEGVSLVTPGQLIFTPDRRIATFECVKPFRKYRLQVDVTWTAASAIANIACRMKVLPDSVMLMYNDIPVKQGDYLVEFEILQFHVVFRTCVPGYVGADPERMMINDVSMRPADCEGIRIFAKHPARKVMRTMVVRNGMSVAQLVQGLFPDLAATVSWSVFAKDGEVDPKPRDVDWMDLLSQLQIQWNCMRPLAITTVGMLHERSDDVSKLASGMAHEHCVRVWVRSPFHVKAKEVLLPRCFPVGRVAATFLAHTQLNSTMIMMANTLVLDPDMRCGDLSSHDVVSCRICPLPGGGKNDALKHRIGMCLRSRGVPSDVVEQRVQDFLTQCSFDGLAGIDEDDDEKFWDVLKTKASDGKFRLVLHYELKAHKQNARKPPSKMPKAPSGKKDNQKEIIRASDMVIDGRHFWSEDQPIVMLDAQRFGPDQCGLSVMDVKQTKAHLPVRSISTDPLAILVVGDGVKDFGGEVLQIPAFRKDGSPIVVSAVILNFGDEQVTFKAALPALELEQLPSTVVEFHIFKEHVKTWSEASVPLNYVGLHVPALRGSKLIGCWSVRTYGENRLPTPMKSASYIHGYMRIEDSILNQVLQRSGQAGIFTSPKTGEKKHDPRYVVIPIQVTSLEKALQLTVGNEWALGIVKRSEGFAIRCLRENGNAMRSKLQPEAAYVQSGTFDSNDHMYVLKNVPVQVGRNELSQALQNKGWNASAVKCQGQNSWLIAARQKPSEMHFVINNAMTFVEPLKKSESGSAIMVARELQITTTTATDPVSGATALSTATRLTEVKTEIQAQVSAIVDQKMQVANSKIEALANALEQSQLEAKAAQAQAACEVAGLKQEQEYVKQKVSDVESMVQQSASGIVGEMGNMMQKMQKTLQASMSKMQATFETRLDDLEGTHKRQKIDVADGS